MRRLADLSGIGPAMLKDFEVLGVRSVKQLAECEVRPLYNELCRRTGQSHDPCVIDVFACAIAQARDENLPPEKKKWWYWSKLRKAGQI